MTTARRYPKHDYPVVCLHLRPKLGSRVQKLDGEEGLDVLLTHEEFAAHGQALAEADPAFKDYRPPTVPAKPASRKARWDRINQERCAKHGRRNSR